MIQLVPATVAVDVEARSHELIEARRSILDELVRAAVEREVERLVNIELEQVVEDPTSPLAARARPSRPGGHLGGGSTDGRVSTPAAEISMHTHTSISIDELARRVAQTSAPRPAADLRDWLLAGDFRSRRQRPAPADRAHGRARGRDRLNKIARAYSGHVPTYS
jgi:hypothetical protein